MFGSGKGGRRLAKQEYAVIGLGRFGTSVARRLVESGHTVLGIDIDPALVQRISHEITEVVSLDSTDEEALREVDIPSYSTVIVAIGTNFEANLMTSVALKALNVPIVICKATTEMQRDILLRVGVDQVVLPEFDAGERLAAQLTSPAVIGEIELSEKMRVSEVRVPTPFQGLSIDQIDLKATYDLSIVAIQRGETVLISPKLSTVLRKDDLLVVIGPHHGVTRFSTGE